MEADWEFEIGATAPVIEAYWSGFVDLRSQPLRIAELSEFRELPALAESLLGLNGPDSPVWTSKSDVFTPECIDPHELNASIEDASHALAGYVDVLFRSNHGWPDPPTAEAACRQICGGLRAIELSCCRIDIVVREALVASEKGLAATVYFSACGSSCTEAESRLGDCLSAFTKTIMIR